MEFAGTFIITDATLDGHSERVLPEGVNVERFLKNPVMLWGHVRANGWDGAMAKLLPIGRWENVKLENQQWKADAWIDTGDDFGRDILRKVKAGIINATSIGFRALAYSDAPEDKIKGQSGVTITKAELREVSLVDIPSNPNTVAVKSLFQKTAEDSEGETDQVHAVKYYSNNNKKTDMSIFDKMKAAFAANPEIKEDEFKAKFDQVFDLKSFKDAEETFATKAELSTEIKTAVTAIKTVLAEAKKPEAVNGLIDAKIKTLQESEEFKSLINSEVAKAIADATKGTQASGAEGEGTILDSGKTTTSSTKSNFEQAQEMSPKKAAEILEKMGL